MKMINNLKRTAEMNDLQIIYGELPKGLNRLYIQSPQGYEWISIDESIRGTKDEIEAISYCLGVNAAIDVIGRSNLNIISEKEIDKLALIYQRTTMRELELLEG